MNNRYHLKELTRRNNGWIVTDDGVVIHKNHKEYAEAHEAWTRQRTAMIRRKMELLGMPIPEVIDLSAKFNSRLGRDLAMRGIVYSERITPAIHVSDYTMSVADRPHREKPRPVTSTELLMWSKPRIYKEWNPERRVKTRKTATDCIRYYDRDRRLWIEFRSEAQRDQFVARLESKERIFLDSGINTIELFGRAVV